jgi:tight adherence protein B
MTAELFDLSYLFYALAAASVILFAEAIYLTLFAGGSYRQLINRRLRLLDQDTDRENVLVKLRRDRGLTSGGSYVLPTESLNRLVLQSGLTIGVSKLVGIVALVAIVLFGAQTYMWDEYLRNAGVALIAGLVVTFVMLRTLRSRRHKRFGSQLPDALDIIVRSLRSGHPVPVSLAMVAKQMPDPVGTEFGIITDEITYGATLETAMRNLFFRVGQEDLPLFVTAVSIQCSTGGNLSEILSNLSAVIRQRFKMRRKVRALAAEGRFSALFLSLVPVILFFLLKIVTPDFYSSVWHIDATQYGLGAAAVWMMIGNFIMYRLVNFRI